MESDSRIMLLRTLELLVTETDEAHPMTISDIINLLSDKWGITAFRITVQRDISSLISAGYDIVSIRSTQNRYYLATM